jgi:hypothetical protein
VVLDPSSVLSGPSAKWLEEENEQRGVLHGPAASAGDE